MSLRDTSQAMSQENVELVQRAYVAKTAAVMWQAIKIRGGQATWWMVCNSEQEALQAAGLSE
jgi:hypothetical protein